MSNNVKTIIYIYTLNDPTNNNVYYVGKTNNPKNRYKQHVYEAKHTRKKTKLYQWMGQLLKNGQKPIMDIIDEVEVEQWESTEQLHINNHKNNGHLLNMTEGGLTFAKV
jgi:predicted GIY-YIG superfamily endonuclease